MRLLQGLGHFARGVAGSLLLTNQSSLAGRYRRWFYWTECLIDTNVVIANRNNFICGSDCALYHGTYILNKGGTLTMGTNSHFGAMCFVNVNEGSVVVGNNVAIGPHTTLAAYSNGYSKGKLVTEVRVCEDIEIGNNVFIGAGSTLLPGCVIEDNVIVGAGALVRGRLKQNTIYVGVPCKPIREGWYY